MNGALLGVSATAGALGVTHAIEPDHVAGIASLTSREADTRLSALAGACFSLGHVVLVVAWLVVGYLLLVRTSFAPIYDTVGTIGVGLLLGALGAAMTVGGLRSLVHTHEHAHGGERHTHAHLHRPAFDRIRSVLKASRGEDSDHERAQHDGDHIYSHHSGAEHAHVHSTVSYLKTGLVGALFTLSPPLSMIVFTATLFPQRGAATVGFAVAVYAVAITATMSLLGAGVGVAAGAVAERPRVYGLVRAVAGVAVIGLAASMLETTLPVLV